MISCQQICVNACKREQSDWEYDDNCDGGGPSRNGPRSIGLA